MSHKVGDTVTVSAHGETLNGLVTSVNSNGSFNVATTSEANSVDRYGHQVRYYTSVTTNPEDHPQRVHLVKNK